VERPWAGEELDVGARLFEVVHAVDDLVIGLPLDLAFLDLGRAMNGHAGVIDAAFLYRQAGELRLFRRFEAVPGPEPFEIHPVAHLLLLLGLDGDCTRRRGDTRLALGLFSLSEGDSSRPEQDQAKTHNRCCLFAHVFLHGRLCRIVRQFPGGWSRSRFCQSGCRLLLTWNSAYSAVEIFPSLFLSMNCSVENLCNA
jgi:hypothetical protein